MKFGDESHQREGSLTEEMSKAETAAYGGCAGYSVAFVVSGGLTGLGVFIGVVTGVWVIPSLLIGLGICLPGLGLLLGAGAGALVGGPRKAYEKKSPWFYLIWLFVAFLPAALVVYLVTRPGALS